MSEFKPSELIKDTTIEILEELKSKLEEIDDKETKEIYFHDIVTEIVDSNTPQDRSEAIELIDYTGNEKYADKGIIDTSDLTRYCVTMAYECLHQELFNDDFIQELQSELNNETISFEKAQELIKKIDEKLKELKR